MPDENRSLSGISFNWAPLPACGFVFITVFAALFALKADFIVHNIMIADDLIFHPGVRMEGWTSPYATLPVSSYLYRVTAKLSPHISWQILAYLMMIAMTATFVYLWLNRYFASSLILISAILFSFTSPAVTSMGNFVSGSHGMIGFMFASLGLLFSSRSMAAGTHVTGGIALATAAGISFVLAALSSPFFHLFFLSSVFYNPSILAIPLPRVPSCHRPRYPWERRRPVGKRAARPANAPTERLQSPIPCKRNRSGIWIPIVFTLVPSCATLAYKLIWNRYHYDNIKGWTDWSALHMLERSWNYVEYMLKPYGQGLPDPWLAGAATAICVVLLWIAAKITRPLAQRETGSWKRMSATNILVMLSGLALSSMPILPATANFAPRYLFPPMVIAVLLLFAIVEWIARSHPGRFHRAKWGCHVLICGLLGYNISVTHSFQNERYGALLRYQPMLAGFVQERSADWPQGAQVILASDIPSSFTVGYNHWSTGFLRTHTGDETVIGLIGREDWMDAEDPFVELYRHHHGQYWEIVERDGTPYSSRRRMFGLVKSRPTYAYRFDASDGTAQRVHWLLVNASGGGWDLYRMTGEGIVLHESGIDTSAGLDRLGIARKDVFIYGKAN